MSTETITLPATLGELESRGCTLFSRWQSMKSGRLAIIVNRTWTWGEHIVVTVLDVESETASDVRADDWLRWVKNKSFVRIK